MSGFVTQFYHCLQHVSLTVTGEISLFRSHKKNRNSIHKKRFSSAQCNHILWWPGSAQTRWRSLQHSRKPLSWILRGLLRLLRKGESREGGGIKRREERRGNGREGKGRRGEWREEIEMEGIGACTHWNFRKSAPMAPGVQCGPIIGQGSILVSWFDSSIHFSRRL